MTSKVRVLLPPPTISSTYGHFSARGQVRPRAVSALCQHLPSRPRQGHVAPCQPDGVTRMTMLAQVQHPAPSPAAWTARWCAIAWSRRSTSTAGCRGNGDTALSARPGRRRNPRVRRYRALARRRAARTGLAKLGTGAGIAAEVTRMEESFGWLQCGAVSRAPLSRSMGSGNRNASIGQRHAAQAGP